ncbi:MAG: NADH:ubiquinone reductase (Na(+)-transporting) subunit C [Alistipes sp.]|nr:NADH:ubiquinone reductase (Na(+)-transporting) subunit C [Alistipes sp.]MBR0330781.1 NADH:ubiquinone reductase (Na(+)-transporting) subunit C [Alistipes sp.]
MNKNSNTYIIIYSTVMVVVVATLLAVASLALKSRQDANILNEKKQAILASLSMTGQNYDESITAYVVNGDGEKVEGQDPLQLLFDLPTAFDQQTLPVFEAQDGRIVVPVSGTGLWGPMWGYVALEQDMNTVSGVVLDHAGETPGLGAEVATPKHQAMYKGKTLFEGDEFVSITLRKGGAKDEAHEVDAISGGTKTSDGVTDMLKKSLGAYLPLLESKKASEVASEACETECETNNVENNE